MPLHSKNAMDLLVAIGGQIKEAKPERKLRKLIGNFGAYPLEGPPPSKGAVGGQ